MNLKRNTAFLIADCMKPNCTQLDLVDPESAINLFSRGSPTLWVATLKHAALLPQPISIV